jgi:hypothetical protein
MNEEKPLSQQESLLIIQQMINTAKTEQQDDGKGWIIWGWMLFLASVFTLLNMRFDWSGDLFLFWNIFGGLAFIIMVFEVVRNKFFKKSIKVKTYTGDLFMKLNAGFFISLMFIIFAINLGSRYIHDEFGKGSMVFVNIGFALLINLYAFWILVYGAALNFKPSIIGAYACFALGFTAMFINEFEWTMILHAGAILIGYIIPGHIANNEFRKIHSKG